MRRVLYIVLLAVALSALLSAGAYACGEKKADDEKANTDTKAQSELVKSRDKVCPAAAGAFTCGGKDKPTATAVVSAEGDQWPMRTMSVVGMTCAGCEKTISDALTEVPGVVEVVEVCHETGQAVVRVDPEKASDDLLTSAVANKGYEAKIIPAVVKSTEPAPNGKICPLSGNPACAGSAAKAATEKNAEETK